MADVSGVFGIVKRCLICEDHPLLANAFASTIAKIWPRVEVFQRHNLTSALDLSGQTFNLAIIDLGLAGGAPEAGVRLLIDAMPQTPFLVFAGYATDDTLARIMALGVSGLVDRSSSAVVIESAMRLVGAGERYFSERLLRLSVAATPSPILAPAPVQSAPYHITARQKAVLILVSNGLTNKEIANVLGISASTVKTHVEILIAKFAATNRTQIAILGKQSGII